MKLDQLVRKHYNKLNPNEVYIWNYIANNKEACVHMSIEEIGEKCSVSRTSILRFCKKISLQGYSELKFYLRQEISCDNELTEDKIENLFDEYNHVFRDLSKENFDRAFQYIYESRRLFAYGSGIVQQSALKELKRLLFKLDIEMHIFAGGSEITALQSNVKEGDTIIIMSLSGETEGVTSLSKSLKGSPAKIISITRRQDSTLSQNSDCALYFTSPMENMTVSGLPFDPVAMFFLVVEIFFLKFVLYRNKRLTNQTGQTNEE